MDLNDYAFEIVVRGRLTELRADAERCHRHESGRLTSHVLRDAVGRAFSRVGTRLLCVWKASLSEVWP